MISIRQRTLTERYNKHCGAKALRCFLFRLRRHSPGPVIVLVSNKEDQWASGLKNVRERVINNSVGPTSHRRTHDSAQITMKWKYELKQKIEMLQKTVDHISGSEYGAAIDIFEELLNKSAGANNIERRDIFRSITLDVSLQLYMWLKKHIRPSYFKYSSDYITYFGTDDEFEEIKKP